MSPELNSVISDIADLHCSCKRLISLQTGNKLCVNWQQPKDTH